MLKLVRRFAPPPPSTRGLSMVVVVEGVKVLSLSLPPSLLPSSLPLLPPAPVRLPQVLLRPAAPPWLEARPEEDAEAATGRAVQAAFPILWTCH